jgi:hypothetical protein
MRPVSEAFLRALRGTHSIQIEALVVPAGQTGIEPSGDLLEVLNGDVTMDADAAIRSTLDLTVKTDFPNTATDLLAPYGQDEIFIRYGVVFGNGRVEWVSLGYFRIYSVEQDDAHSGIVRIAGQDRMGAIIDARLFHPITFTASNTYGDVVDDLANHHVPWTAVVEWDDDTDTHTLGRKLITEEDRYKFLDDLVKSKGKIWYWDHRGHLVIKDPPDTSDPGWDVNEGENGVLVSLSREISREGVYNAVMVKGEALDGTTPVYAVAMDLGPDSPTNAAGPFGVVPKFYTSQFITTTAQALNTATEMLRENLGAPYNVDFQAIVNPALEPFDPVYVIFSDRTEIHTMSRLVIPLIHSRAMQGETREQTDVVIGDGS